MQGIPDGKQLGFDAGIPRVFRILPVEIEAKVIKPHRVAVVGGHRMEVAVQRQQHVPLLEGVFAVVDACGSASGYDKADFVTELHVRFPVVAGIGVDIPDLVQDKWPEFDRVEIKQIIKMEFGVFCFQPFFLLSYGLFIAYSDVFYKEISGDLVNLFHYY